MMTIDEGGAARDARHERDRGCHVPADEARRRAQVRHELAGIPCRDCGTPALRVEWRSKLAAKPVGTFSLAGVQAKLAAEETPWPWAVCDNCGAESEGKPA